MGYARFTLALGVVAFHSGLGGYGGVYMLYGFYIISGYVIHKSIAKNYQGKPNWVFIFFLKRFLRLIPSFIVASIILYITFISICNLSSTHDCKDLPTNVVNYITSRHLNLHDLWAGIQPNVILKTSPPQAIAFFGFVSPFWSVSLELLFYLLAPFIFASKMRPRLYLLLIVTAAIYFYYSFYLVGKNDMGRWMDIVYRNFFPTMLFFIMGACASQLEMSRHIAKPAKETLAKATKPIFICSIFCVLYLSREANLTPQNYIIHHHILLSIVVLATLLTIYCDKIKNERSRNLDFFLGELSYPIYINHNTVILAVIAYEHFYAEPQTLSALIKIPLILLLTIFLSMVFYFLFEKRLNRIRKSIG